MPTFQKCSQVIKDLANEVLCEFESHKPLLDARVTIDYVFAFGDKDEDGHLVNDALKKNGVKALGIARKIPLKDRALGRSDGEIALDGDWWGDASDAEQRALLDHELHHFAVKIDKRGLVRDDLGRPVLQLRHHDIDCGWFKIVAERHGQHSQERIQARAIMDQYGQAFWPDIIAAQK